MFGLDILEYFVHDLFLWFYNEFQVRSIETLGKPDID